LARSRRGPLERRPWLALARRPSAAVALVLASAIDRHPVGAVRRRLVRLGARRGRLARSARRGAGPAPNMRRAVNCMCSASARNATRIHVGQSDAKLLHPIGALSASAYPYSRGLLSRAPPARAVGECSFLTAARRHPVMGLTSRPGARKSFSVVVGQPPVLAARLIDRRGERTRCDAAYSVFRNMDRAGSPYPVPSAVLSYAETRPARASPERRLGFSCVTSKWALQHYFRGSFWG